MALNSWTCDSCGDQITDPNKGTVIWRDDDEDRGFKAYDFLVVHKNLDGHHCDPGAQSGYRSNLDIEAFLGDHGREMMLAFLSLGPMKGPSGDFFPRVKDFDGFVDLFRRMQTAGYEEARPRFNDEDVQHWLGDANEYYPYLPEVLDRINNHTLGEGQ